MTLIIEEHNALAEEREKTRIALTELLTDFIDSGPGRLAAIYALRDAFEAVAKRWETAFGKPATIEKTTAQRLDKLGDQLINLVIKRSKQLEG